MRRPLLMGWWMSVTLGWASHSSPLLLVVVFVESSTRTVPNQLRRDSSLCLRRGVMKVTPPDVQEEEENTFYLQSDNNDEDEEDELLLHLLQQQQRRYDRIQILSAARILESSSSGGSPSIPDDDDDAMMMMTTTTTSITNHQPPRMNLQDMAHVLQFTSGLNAQLQQVCHPSRTSRAFVTHVDPPRRILRQQQPPPRHGRSSHQRMDDLRGGGGRRVVELRSDDHPATEPYRIRPGMEMTIPTTARSSSSPPTFWTSSSSSFVEIDGRSGTLTDVSMAFQRPASNMEHLHDYLLQVHDLLRVEPSAQEDDTLDDDAAENSNTSLERTLMMLYLDRACRRGGGVGGRGRSHPHCSMKQLPYCTPTTVHYLSVTAMCVAAGTVRGDLISLLSSSSSSSSTTEHWNDNDVAGDHLERYDRILTSSPFMQSLFQKLQVHLNIPARDSQRRVAFMLQALDVGPGRTDDDDDDDDYDDDAGIFVTPTALQEWKEQWESKFT